MNYYQRFKKLYIAFFIVILIVIVGVIGFSTIENYSFGDSLYMTIITVSTVGFQEVKPLSEAGRNFTMFLIVLV